MSKTFWSVKYRLWGADFCCYAWFDNYKDAKEFAKVDFRDNPVKHTYRKKKSIKEAEGRCKLTINGLYECEV